MSVKDGNGSRAHAVTLGALIRELRESLGWSQSRLASALCAVANHETVTREIVSRWETGKRVPGPWWLRHLATVLQTPLEIVERAGVDRRRFLTEVSGASIAPLVASDLIEHGFAAALHGGYPSVDDWSHVVDTYGRDYMTSGAGEIQQCLAAESLCPSAATGYPMPLGRRRDVGDAVRKDVSRQRRDQGPHLVSACSHLRRPIRQPEHPCLGAWQGGHRAGL
jgi:transcriptional regulator with XRE-family HTH domain